MTSLRTRASAAPTAGAGPAGAGPAGAGPCPAPVARLVTRTVLGVALGASAVGAAVRLVDGDALVAAGPAVLAVAVLVGLPHGALDAELLVGPGQGHRARVVTGTVYLLAAVAVYALWWHSPALGVGVLLAVSAAHFAAADAAVLAWVDGPGRPGTRTTAAVTGLTAVAGPFAWWPRDTARVLGQLGVDAVGAAAVTAVARVLLVVALVPATVVTVGLWRSGRRRTALEPAAVGVLTAVCPPLVAFAVYFAGWHATRQTARLLVLHPGAGRDLRRSGVRAAVRTLGRRGWAPSLAALLALVALVAVDGGGLPATVLAALLAVSVPHAAVTAWREHASGRDAGRQDVRSPSRATRAATTRRPVFSSRLARRRRSTATSSLT